MAVTIVSSAIVVNNPQADGRSVVREQHVDSIGNNYYIDYIADISVNTATHLAASATSLGVSVPAQLAATEILANITAVLSIGSLAVPTFVYSTVAQNVAALRAAYKVATKTDAIMIGDFMNTLTSAQLQSAFGFTPAQVTALQPTFAAAATQATAIRAAVGV